MKRYLAYLKAVFRHKICVYQEGRKLGLWPLRLLWHDWDKFLPFMFIAYARSFFNPDGTSRNVRDASGYYDAARTEGAFNFAWLLHQKRNRHHWQWWTLPLDDGGIKCIEMSPVDRLEMLADWRGAGRAYGNPDTKGWYQKNQDKMQLGPDTRKWIEAQLGIQREVVFSTPEEKLIWQTYSNLLEKVMIQGDPRYNAHLGTKDNNGDYHLPTKQ